MNNLVGEDVMDTISRRRGVIQSVRGNRITVDFHGEIESYPFPSAFASHLRLKNKRLQETFSTVSKIDDFQNFKAQYLKALKDEIDFLKTTGGKKYKIFDGELISKNERTCIYSFDTDTELHFPDNTTIRLRLKDSITTAFVKTCENFTIFIQTYDYLGPKVPIAEFTAEPWQLMEALVDRLNTLNITENSIAYKIACEGKYQIEQQPGIQIGQEAAKEKALKDPITFIWGPPGTGKTRTLAQIAINAISSGMRVLMLSYSNVSVDGALLRVAEMADYIPGDIIRYGYPRKEELLESSDLTSYAYILSQNKTLEARYKSLQKAKHGLSKKSSDRIRIDKEIKSIRTKLLDEEKRLINRAHFVATTVSKAIVDKEIYSQTFDLVIFDEASMAYVPQIIFAASLTKKHFCCLGDFRQLPAIVQDQNNNILEMDIFEHTGITRAVQNGYRHHWLVMLNEQFRMHEKIAEFVSDKLYVGLLKSSETAALATHQITDVKPFPGRPITLVDLSGMYSVCTLTGDRSHINLLSAMLCVRLAELYADKFPVGIITPYSAQSRLILAMIRDLRENDNKYNNVTSATVHQFQGSEEAIIIYDAVDCFRIKAPGILLTSQKNDTADRLFNVALTRARGKFIILTNKDYMLRKKISETLLFTKMLRKNEFENSIVSGDSVINILGTAEGEQTDIFLGDRDEYDSWNRYIADISNAAKEIHIDLPGPINDDLDGLDILIKSLTTVNDKGIEICIRYEGNFALPKELLPYTNIHSYVSTPITIIDQQIVWFGEPLSAANFISNRNILKTQYFPCLRFSGKYTAKMLKSVFE